MTERAALISVISMTLSVYIVSKDMMLQQENLIVVSSCEASLKNKSSVNAELLFFQLIEIISLHQPGTAPGLCLSKDGSVKPK